MDRNELSTTEQRRQHKELVGAINNVAKQISLLNNLLTNILATGDVTFSIEQQEALRGFMASQKSFEELVQLNAKGECADES